MYFDLAAYKCGRPLPQSEKMLEAEYTHTTVILDENGICSEFVCLMYYDKIIKTMCEVHSTIY